MSAHKVEPLRISAKIYFCPPDKLDPSTGWGWEVRHGDALYAEEIVPERSRQIAVDCVLKYISELLNASPESED